MTHALVATPLGCSGLFRPARRDVRAQAQQQQPGGAPPQGVRPQCYEGPALRASRIPTPEEDREVAHSAFLHAFQSAQPEKLRIHGMQEFAGAVSAGAGQGRAALGARALPIAADLALPPADGCQLQAVVPSAPSAPPLLPWAGCRGALPCAPSRSPSQYSSLPVPALARSCWRAAASPRSSTSTR